MRECTQCGESISPGTEYAILRGYSYEHIFCSSTCLEVSRGEQAEEECIDLGEFVECPYCDAILLTGKDMLHHDCAITGWTITTDDLRALVDRSRGGYDMGWRDQYGNPYDMGWRDDFT